MDTKDNLTLISYEDMYGYIRLKSVEDYAYNDAIWMLNNKDYTKVPYEFITFMGRMLESTMIRLYPRKDVGDMLFEKTIYTIPAEDNYPIRVRYRQGDEIRIVQYSTDYVVTEFNTGKLEAFVQEYMNRSIERMYRKESNLIVNDIHGGMFHVLRWVETYLGDKKGISWEDGMNKRIEEFMVKLNNYTSKNGIRYPDYLEDFIRSTFTERKDGTRLGN